MVVLVGSMATGKQMCARVLRESLHLIPKHTAERGEGGGGGEERGEGRGKGGGREREREKLTWCRLVKHQNLPLVTNLLQHGYTS